MAQLGQEMIKCLFNVIGIGLIVEPCRNFCHLLPMPTLHTLGFYWNSCNVFFSIHQSQNILYKQVWSPLEKGENCLTQNHSGNSVRFDERKTWKQLGPHCHQLHKLLSPVCVQLSWDGGMSAQRTTGHLITALWGWMVYARDSFKLDYLFLWCTFETDFICIHSFASNFSSLVTFLCLKIFFMPQWKSLMWEPSARLLWQ